VTRVTVWDSLVDPGSMSPGVPSDLVRTPDVLVVGGGAVGLCVAVACQRAGLGRVVVLEKEPRLASSASGANAGSIAPDMHVMTDSAAFVSFGRWSRDLYRAWDGEWDGALGLVPTRWLTIAGPGQPVDVAGEPLSPAAVSALEPDVRVPEGGAAILVDGQLRVNPQRLVAELSRHAGQVAAGVAMLDVTVRGNRIVTVHTPAGDFAPGAVVVATGLVPAPWAAGVPQRWVKGHMAAVAPGGWSVGSILAGPLGGGTPLADGTMVCGGTFDDGDLSPDVVPAVADTLVTALARVLPAAASATTTHRWCCFRPRIEGRQPVVDRLPGVVNGWFAGGHFTTGIMMAAATGAAVADWVASSVAPAAVAGFDLPVRR